MNILLVGCCGSGKTWVMKNLIKKHKLRMNAKVKLIKFRTNGKLSVMGVYDGSTFEGTDKLSMAVMRDIAEFEKVRTMRNMVAVAEGDRFTNASYIKACQPYIIKITDDGTQGRAKRNSSQTERHIKAIKTRVNNIQADEEVKDSSEALERIESLLCKYLT